MKSSTIRIFQEKKDLLGLIVDSIPASISYVDKHFNYLFVNQRFEDWIGVKLSEIADKSISQVMGRPYFENCLPYLQRALEGEKVEFEYSLPFQGRIKHLQIKYVPFQATDDDPGILVLGLDITDMKNIQLDQRLLATLAATNSKTSDVASIISTTTEALAKHLHASRSWLCQIDQQRVSVNSDYADKLESLQGIYDLRTFGSFLLEAWQTGTVSCVNDVEQDPRTKMNAPEYVNLGIFSFITIPLYRGGKLVAALNVSSDKKRTWNDQEMEIARTVSENAWSVIENARLFNALQSAVSSRDEFLRVCTHELKTPLTSMMLQNQHADRLIQKDDPTAYSPEVIKKRVEVSNRQLDRMAKLIENMLDVSRIAAGKLTCEFAPMELGELTQKVVERFLPQIESAGIKLHTNLDSPSLIMGDAKRLDQVLSNMIDNAIKFGDSKPISLIIETHEHKILLKVIDQGIGIPPEKLSRIFHRFEGQAVHSPISGLGLGLHIISEVIHQHDGHILVDSQVDQGSTFTIELPLLEDPT